MVSHSDANFIDNEFFFKTERIADSKEKQKKYVIAEDIGVAISLVGVIYNFSELCGLYGVKTSSDVELLLEMYRRKKERFVGELNGLFTLLIYDLRKHELFVFQDIYSSPINLYYCVSEDIFLFSTSLKDLLLMGNNDRELDEIGATNYLIKSCIPSEHTLIENIYKLIPGQYLEISKNNDFPQINLFPNIKTSRITQKQCQQEYYEIFKRCVHRSISNLDSINIALSSGYDSNFLLYAANDLAKEKIRVFTIGGKEGQDETRNASAITNYYQNVEHHKYLVDEKMFEFLPEIVWRQEDLVYLPSNHVKLQLAKVAEKNGCRTIISGDGCDEALTMPNRVSWKIKIWELLKSISFVRHVYCFFNKGKVRLPCFKCGFNKKLRIKNFELGAFRILKHVGIIFNSFSIGLRLPYLDKEYFDCARKLLNLNKDKAFHHSFVGALLPEPVTQLIQHLSGRIDEGFMFEKYKEAICRKVKNSAIAKKYIGSDLIDIMVEQPTKYLDILLRILYLDIFLEVFLSGRYDSTFKQEHFDISLSKFLKDIN